jgi:hypothetical protein
MEELALGRGRMGGRGAAIAEWARNRERWKEWGGFLCAREEDGRLIRKHPASATTDTWALDMGEQ